MGFFAMMNPISGISIFLALTLEEDEEETRRIAFKSLLTAFIIVVVFAVAGHFILKIFGISFTALRLAGGILVGLIGYEMLHGKTSTVNKPSKDTIQDTIDKDSTLAFSPLGTPLLAGPGVIITAMNFASGCVEKLLITVATFALLCLMTYFAFLSGRKIKDFLGMSVLKVITRMMGLILAVIGVQMLIEGIYSAIREFSLI